MKKFVMFLAVMFIAGSVNAASFTITIPDEILTDVVEAFSVKFNYQEEVSNPEYLPEDPESLSMIPNPMTKAEFAKGHIRRVIRDVYLETQMRERERQIRLEIEQINADTQEITVE